MPYLKKLPKPIPLSLGYVGANVLSLLTDDALIAQWNNEGLPADNMSTENATILTNSVKWPLIIDPQLQGIKWIKSRFSKDLTVIRLGQKGYLEVVEKSVSGVIMAKTCVSRQITFVTYTFYINRLFLGRFSATISNSE